MHNAADSKRTTDSALRLVTPRLVAERYKDFGTGEPQVAYDIDYNIDIGGVDTQRGIYFGVLDPAKLAVIERALSEIRTGERWAKLLNTSTDYTHAVIDTANHSIAAQRRKLNKLAAKVGLVRNGTCYDQSDRDLDFDAFNDDLNASILLGQFALASKVHWTLLEEIIVALIRELTEVGAELATKFETIMSAARRLQKCELRLEEAMFELHWVPENVRTFEARVAELRRIVKEGGKQ